jgi:hypothetical protein
MQALGEMHGGDAFHRVRNFARNDSDAVERVPAVKNLARATWPAWPATRAVARTHKHNKERY